jgi:hypothetical protein
VTQKSAWISSPDGLFQVTIPEGIQAWNSSASPLGEVRLVQTANPPVPIPWIGGSSDTGISYTILPDGATFNPPVPVVITIPPALWDDHMDYTVWQCDSGVMQWNEVPTNFSPADRSLSIQISRSGTFAVLKKQVPQSPMNEQVPPVPAVAGKPGSDQFSIITGMVVWIGEHLAKYFSVAIVVLAAVCIAVLLLSRRRYRI